MVVRIDMLTNTTTVGGKVKPLKQAKKDKKDLDDEDKAYQEKKRAGTRFRYSITASMAFH